MRASLFAVGVALIGITASGCKKAGDQAGAPADPAARAAMQAAAAANKVALDKGEKEIASKDYDAAVGDIMGTISTNMSAADAQRAYELQMRIAQAAEHDPKAKQAEDAMRRYSKGR